MQIKDRDCYVWDPQPVAGESVTWTGECEGGFATGIGKEHWFTATGASSNQLEGKETAGKLEGEVTVTYADGSRYVGNLDASGNRTGLGELTYSNGIFAKGVFIDGAYDGDATISYPDGRRYLGNVNASGTPAGFGMLTYPTGLNGPTRQCYGWNRVHKYPMKTCGYTLTDKFHSEIDFIKGAPVLGLLCLRSGGNEGDPHGGTRR